MKKLSKKLIGLLAFSVLFSSAFAIDGLVRDSVFILSAKIKDFSDSGIRENITRGKAVTSSPLDLQVGDIFMDVNGHAKKVKSIVRSGNTISINTVTPEISEVFDGFNIPEQDADFQAAIKERDAMSSMNYYDGDEELTRGETVSKTMLDNVMPTSKGYTKWSFTITPKTVPISSLGKSNFDDLKKIATEEIEKAKASKDKETIKNMEGLKAMISKRETAVNTATSFSITPQVRYKSWQNKAIYSASYAKISINKHGTWKIWKWTTKYDPGFVKYDWYRDTELGLGLKAEGAIKTNAVVPIPGASWGEGTSGPYAGLYFELNASGAISAEYQYYKRSAHHTSAFSNFNLIFVPSNTSAGDYGWEPDAHQIIVCANGNVTLGPSVKAGLVFFGMNLLELKASGGGKLDMNVGGAWTKVNCETDDYNKLLASLDDSSEAKIMKANVTEAKAKIDELNKCSGLQFYGRITVGLFANVKFSAFKNILSFNLLDINRILWATDGKGEPFPTTYESPFANGKWDL